MENFRDAELKKWLAEEYEKETEEMEKILFPDGVIPDDGETEEEAKAAYQRLVEKLKADGVYKEDETDSIKTDDHKENVKIVYLPEKKSHKAARVAAAVLVCSAGIFAASMTSQANRSYFIDSVRYWVGDDTSISIENDESEKYIHGFKTYLIKNIYEETTKELEKNNLMDLFNNIEMPLVTVLGEMQYNGMKVDKEGLTRFGESLKEKLEEIRKQIYELCGEEFNINSTQQLGNRLFEKLKLPVYKKNKSGYSTDVEILEKLKDEHPVIEKILEYRSLMKLNSTYVEGLIPYINEKTGRIHSYFHQTITATGRISSTEPNLQNIPTRMELGKQLRKVFKPEDGFIFIDADYSQIELRVLAHVSKDEHMVEAFKNDEDIHKQVASKVLGIPMDEVTKEQRSSAKAVNFGIVYGISDFGLAQQLGISKKQAKQYIDQYLEKYSGIKSFMDNIIEEAKEKGYVETLFHRRRYITELSSNNYMVRQFGARAAMNTPIQGTAADIMKIAMINVYNKLKEQKLDAKLILQIHDELIIECKEEEKEIAKKILQDCMENVTKLEIPLKVEVSEAKDWYDAK